jgi:hypothetical protein
MPSYVAQIARINRFMFTGIEAPLDRFSKKSKSRAVMPGNNKIKHTPLTGPGPSITSAREKASHIYVHLLRLVYQN